MSVPYNNWRGAGGANGSSRESLAGDPLGLTSMGAASAAAGALGGVPQIDPYGNPIYQYPGEQQENVDDNWDDSQGGINYYDPSIHAVDWDDPSSSYLSLTGSASGNAAQGGAGGGVGQGSALAPNGVSWWNQQFRPQATMQQGLDAWLLGNYMNGPADMAQQATDAIGGQLNANADRNHQRGMLNDILGAVGNIGGGSGPRMQGFQDIRTGQGAALPGTTQSSITAGALGAPRVQAAVATARGGGGDRSAPTAGLPIPAGAQSELDQRYATSMTNQGNQNATELDRYAAGQNAGLKRGAETAAAGQGGDNASWLVRQNASNVQNDSRLKNALLRKAMPIAGMA